MTLWKALGEERVILHKAYKSKKKKKLMRLLPQEKYLKIKACGEFSYSLGIKGMHTDSFLRQILGEKTNYFQRPGILLNTLLYTLCS